MGGQLDGAESISAFAPSRIEMAYRLVLNVWRLGAMRPTSRWRPNIIMQRCLNASVIAQTLVDLIEQGRGHHVRVGSILEMAVSLRRQSKGRIYHTDLGPPQQFSSDHKNRVAKIGLKYR